MVSFMHKFYSFNLKYSVVLHNINCTFRTILTQHYFYQNCRVTFGNVFKNCYVQDITLRKGFHKLRHNLRVLRVFRKCLLKEWPGLKFCVKSHFFQFQKFVIYSKNIGRKSQKKMCGLSKSNWVFLNMEKLVYTSIAAM